MSWRNAPQSAVTLQVLSLVLAACLGLLLGAAWTTQALQPKLRQRADERRRLNEEWAAVRTSRQRSQCPRCATPAFEQSEQSWYEHRVLHAMQSGVAYDLPQVSSVSGTILSQANSVLEKLRDQGYVEARTYPEGTVRYKKVVPHDDDGDGD